MLFIIPHISNVESLHQATQKHEQILYLDYVEYLTHAQLKQSHHYSLTDCVCPGIGSMQEEKQRQNMECKLTNTLQLTTHTYISTTCTLHDLPPCNTPQSIN